MQLTNRARSAPIAPLAVMIALLAIVPAFGSISLRESMTLALIYAIAAIGIDLFSGYGGRLTFASFGLVAVGAYTSGVLTTRWGWGPWETLPAAVIVTALFGWALSFALVRVPDLGAALVTFFFAYLMFQILMGRSLADLTGSVDGLPVEPAILGGQWISEGPTLYYVSLVGLAAVGVVGWRYANSRPGRSLRVIKRSPVVAESNGIRVDATRRGAFVFSAASAGLAGFLYGQLVGVLSPESFATIASVNLTAMAVLGGLGSIAGPILGAVFFVVVNDSAANLGSWSGAIFPIAVLVVLIAAPQGLYGAMEGLWGHIVRRCPDRVRALAVPRRAAAPVVVDDDAAGPVSRRVESVGLRVADVSVSFGGVHALRNVSLHAEPGTIHAIIGPNGAGKTTLLNCISGIQRHAGSIWLGERQLDSLSVRQVRSVGLARTFQHPSLVPDLSALENTAVGVDVRPAWTELGGLVPSAQARAREREVVQAAHRALQTVGLAPSRRDVMASDLSLAEQKCVDVARALAADPDVLLLDEPTAGLDESEIGIIAGALSAVRAAGITTLIIAHHVGFVREIADSISVLDFGEVMAEGLPDEVLRRPEVIDIYIGASNV